MISDCLENQCGIDCSIPCHCSEPTTMWNTLSGTCVGGCVGRWTGVDGRCDIGINVRFKCLLFSFHHNYL